MKSFSCPSIGSITACLFLLLAPIAFPIIASAQTSIIAIVDTTFAQAMGGKVETALGAYDDEATDFYVYFGSKITVCGKVGTADPALERFGVIRLNPEGTFDSTFGTNGRAVLSWGPSDYPNRIYMQPDMTVLAAGVSGLTDLAGDQVPALFKIKSNGEPDSSFGTNGRAVLRHDAASRGEFRNLFPAGNAFIACGSITANSANGSTGFYAVRFGPAGSPDSAFGTNGMGFLPSNVHSVSGFLSKNATVIFTGVLETGGKSVIALGRLTASGQPDSSFGVNGVKNTGIVLTADTEIVSAIQQNFDLLVAAPLQGASQTRPFTLVRFTSDGAIDSSYGTYGLSTIPIAPYATARGINIANNGKTVVNGSVGRTIEQSATARIDLEGVPDPTFNRTGMAVIDLDHGLYSNYLIQFVGIGGKHYMGFGGTRQNGKLNFMVARFKDDTVRSDVRIAQPVRGSFQCYPNPASNEVTITAASGSIQGLSVLLNALGRSIVSSESPRVSLDPGARSLDVSDLPNGLYYCIIESSGIRSMQKFIVAH
ncbi:MAG: T9SS type A sorting domain-containing protein [Bacteroidota bacterium]|nr:T9SS type A sorting domain-containing protein [Bacteroidota bacterium]MDP4233677.1 T9SS type A sorting domain-containing protein [Bacteroidota bacterium]MDP4241866.1 T9SS type A sorting domain-containing protein [Bacteroidota bacterium]MDP4288946.1 T9SS type A sorting domain-containing protein [Bacteroidota bacterium]